MVGYRNTKVGQTSIIQGRNNVDSATHSVVVGVSNINRPNATHALVVGQSNTNGNGILTGSGRYSFTMGSGNVNYGESSLVFGLQNSNLSTGQHNTLIGRDNSLGTSSDHNTIMGIQNEIGSSSDYNNVLGRGLIVGDNVTYATVVGRYNAELPSNTVFAVGNGANSTSRSNLFVITNLSTAGGKVIYSAPLPAYSTHANADSDANLPSGAFYKLTGGREIFQKP